MSIIIVNSVFTLIYLMLLWVVFILSTSMFKAKTYTACISYTITLSLLLIIAGFVLLDCWVQGFYLLELRGG